MLKELKKSRIISYLDRLAVSIGLLSLIVLIMYVGFYVPFEGASYLPMFTYIVVFIYILQEIFRWFYSDGFFHHLKKRLAENILSLILLFIIVFPSFLTTIISFLLSSLEQNIVKELYFELILIFLVLVQIFRATEYSYLISKIALHPGAIFAISFAFVIFTGTLLLLLPKSTHSGISVVDALFTSTSCVCVTGLVVVDTATHFTYLGKLILLFLIQIGGLGVMTLTTFFASFFSGAMSMKMRVLMKDLLSQDSLGSVTKILISITLYTFFLELVGAALLYKFLGGDFSAINSSYLKVAVFHSVSAFCNAGFSTYPGNLMNPEVINNYGFLTVIMLLIIEGGLGFSVLTNLSSLNFRKHRQKRIRYQLTLSTKLVVITTMILVVPGGFVLWAIEPYKANEMTTFFPKLFHSIFQVVTARTAGFNSTDIGLLGAPAVMFLIFLMWIGASPGSTGGGIKTSTFAILSLAFFNTMRGKKNLNIFGREISHQIVEKASMVVLASLLAIFLASFLLIIIEPDKEPLDLIFEVVSALSTVGLSRNLSPLLGTGGKVVDVIVMFIGRIGVLTFFLAFFKPHKEIRYTLPQEQVMIG